MSDLISRAAAIRKYQEVCNGIKCGECPFLIKVNTEKGSHVITDCKLEAFLHNLPSAQPERRKGRWRKGVCECGYDWAKDAPISSVPNFCPQCGADMREIDDESN